MLSIDQVRKMLPHRYPFLLVDKVIEIEEGKRITAVKNVTVNEPFFQGHYPEIPIMPGVMIVEAMAQAGGLAVSGLAEEDSVPLLAAIDQARFKKVVRPGDQLIITAEVIAVRKPFIKIQAQAEVDGQLVAKAQLMFAFAKEGDA